MSVNHPEPPGPQAFDVTQLQTNGRFDTTDPDGLFMTAMHSIIDDRTQQARRDPLGVDSSWTADQLLGIAEKQPELIAKYFPILKNPNNALDIRHILEIIDKHPNHAEGLHPIFEKYPDLIPIYGAFSYYLPKEASDTPIPNTRISKTDKTEDVEKRMTANDTTRKLLLEKLATVEPKEEIKDYPHWEVAHVFDVGRVILFKERRFDASEDILHIRLMPTDSKAYYFMDYTWKILPDGFLDSKADFKDYANFGYLPKNRSIDEEAIMAALTTHPFNSKELTEALEEIPSVEHRLSSTHSR